MTQDFRGVYAVVVTQRDTQILSLADEREPIVVTVPVGTSERDHAVQDRHHRADRTFQYSDAYFAAITAQLDDVSSIVLIGHGHGESNTVVGFKAYLKRIRSPHFWNITGELSTDLSARTSRQLIALAKDCLNDHTQIQAEAG